jgi:hypothetical protein
MTLQQRHMITGRTWTRLVDDQQPLRLAVLTLQLQQGEERGESAFGKNKPVVMDYHVRHETVLIHFYSPLEYVNFTSPACSFE